MQKCRQEDSVLVDVSSNEENVYLQHRHNGAKSWLGLNDRFVEGNFTWADRGVGNFTAWAKNSRITSEDKIVYTHLVCNTATSGMMCLVVIVISTLVKKVS